VLSHALFRPRRARVRSSCCCAVRSLRGEPPGVARTCSAAAARALRACVRGMAAPAAVAPASSPPLAGERHIVATTNVLPLSAVKYEWRLTGVSKEFFTAAAVGNKLVSPRFSAHGLEWALQLYPNGDEAAEQGHVSLFLRLRTQNTTATPSVTLRAGVEPVDQLDSDDVFDTRKSPPEGSSSIWGLAKYLSHAALLKNFDAHVPGGVFTVTAVLQWPGVEACANPRDPRAAGLAAAWGALLARGKYADVMLQCGGERIAAHRLVLCARSSVFAAQLEEGPMQADASAVPVPPEITPHTLRRLLHFLYTDELEPSPPLATHLLNAADHYGVPRLFGICVRALSAALSVDNAADTLTLADQHSAATLKDAALRFVAANAAAVMATPGWAHLFTSHPPLVLEVMHTMATGAPPEAPLRLASAGGDAAGAGEGSNTEERLRKRGR
jgi:speckle-type POZ protein